MPPTLSVVLPNYNHAKFIGRALAALLGQERAADEIIVIDDGSTDDSVAVIERIARPRRRRSACCAIRTTSASFRPCSAAWKRRAANMFTSPRRTIGFFPAFSRWRCAGSRPIPTLACSAAKRCWSTAAATGRSPCGPRCGRGMRAGRIEAAGAKDLLRSTDNWILTGSAIFRRDCVIWAGGFDARLGSFADGFIARKVALKYGFLFEPEIVASWVVFPDSVSRTDGARPATHEIHSRRCSDPDRRRSRLPALVRGRVPRPLAVCRVPPGAPGRSDRAVGPPRTGRAFRRREGQIGVDFGLAAAELGALGDSGPAMVSAAADVAFRAVADDAGDATLAPRFALSVWANTRYDGADYRAGRRLNRSFTF